MTHYLLIVLMAGVLALAGCGKSSKSTASGGPQMDYAKFSQAFQSPTPEQQKSLWKVNQGVRYRMYPQALEGLDALAGDTSLTEPQKKAVSDLLDAIKQAMTNAPAPPAQ